MSTRYVDKHDLERDLDVLLAPNSQYPWCHSCEYHRCGIIIDSHLHL